LGPSKGLFFRKFYAGDTDLKLRQHYKTEGQTMNTSTFSIPSFIEALHIKSPAPDRAEKMALYAWLVGRWSMDVVIYRNDGTKQSTQGMVCAGWVLEGRAIQDIFAVPDLFYGTTLRIYDPSLDAWHIFWNDVVNQVYLSQIGRARGRDVVQEGKETPSLARLYQTSQSGETDATIRWIFSEITANSFHWRSERSTDGAIWRLQREYFASRLSA
jgi:hypothetical protein